ncbi:MAG: hypothetical protein ACTSUE_18280 [Promethearchaeota archaeon]
MSWLQAGCTRGCRLRGVKEGVVTCNATRGGGSCPREFGRFAYVDLIGWAVFGGSRI